MLHLLSNSWLTTFPTTFSPPFLPFSILFSITISHKFANHKFSLSPYSFSFQNPSPWICCKEQSKSPSLEEKIFIKLRTSHHFFSFSLHHLTSTSVPIFSDTTFKPLQTFSPSPQNLKHVFLRNPFLNPFGLCLRCPSIPTSVRTANAGKY